MKKIITSLSSALLILVASLSLTGVALLPGSDFGFEKSRMLVRFYVNSDHFFNLSTPSIILGANSFMVL